MRLNLAKELFQQTELSRINTVGKHIALFNNLSYRANTEFASLLTTQIRFNLHQNQTIRRIIFTTFKVEIRLYCIVAEVIWVILTSYAKLRKKIRIQSLKQPLYSQTRSSVLPKNQDLVLLFKICIHSSFELLNF